MRILGKGITAQAIKSVYKNITWYDDNDLDTFDDSSDELTIVSPGIPPSNELVLKTKNLVSEYDFFIPKDKFTIWISGTNGKTTTTSMTQEILNQYGSIHGGNIGTPLVKLNKNAPIWILETSSFSMHYIENVKPNIYLLLPISDDHLLWHGNFKAYENAKLKPLEKMEYNDIAILPSKYKSIVTNAYCIYYNSSDDLAKQLGIDITKIRLEEPFLLDALLALSTEKILFDKSNYVLINKFKLAEHTLEEFYDNSERLWVNDSKGTNIDATIHALNRYQNKKIELILGGDDKGADLNPLFERLKKLDIKIYCIGSNKERLQKFAENYQINYVIAENLKNAVHLISDKLLCNENNVAILSPAAASLDQFSSYKERGIFLKKLVKSL